MNPQRSHEVKMNASEKGRRKVPEKATVHKSISDL